MLQWNYCHMAWSVAIALCNVGLLQVLCRFDKVCAVDFALDC